MRDAGWLKGVEEVPLGYEESKVASKVETKVGPVWKGITVKIEQRQGYERESRGGPRPNDVTCEN